MSHDASWPWSELALDGPTDLRAVKRAYAARLKQIDRSDPEVFQSLQRAFEIAKKRSAIAEPSTRPSMTELLRDGGSPDAGPADTPLSAFCETTDVVADTVEATCEPEKQTPASSPPLDYGPAPNPGRDKPDASANTEIVELDALWTESSLRGEEEWWLKFQNALSWPWDTMVLDQLLSSKEAQENTRLRFEAEQQLFASLAKNLDQKKMTFHWSMANLLNEHFQWSSDGVALNRRLGYRQEFLPISYAYSQSFRQFGALIKSGKRFQFLLFRIAFFSIAYFYMLFFVFIPPRFDGPDYSPVFIFMVTAVSFAPILFGLLFLRGLMRLTGLTYIIGWLGMRVAPDIAVTLDHRHPVWVFLRWAIATIIVIFVMRE